MKNENTENDALTTEALDHVVGGVMDPDLDGDGIGDGIGCLPKYWPILKR